MDLNPCWFKNQGRVWPVWCNTYHYELLVSLSLSEWIKVCILVSELKLRAESCSVLLVYMDFWRTNKIWCCVSFSECRDALLPLLIDQLSGQLDDNSNKPDHEASSQLLSSILEVLDRKDVVSMNSQGCKLRLILSFPQLLKKSPTKTDVYRNFIVLLCIFFNLFTQSSCVQKDVMQRLNWWLLLCTKKSAFLPGNQNAVLSYFGGLVDYYGTTDLSIWFLTEIETTVIQLGEYSYAPHDSWKLILSCFEKSNLKWRIVQGTNVK